MDKNQALDNLREIVETLNELGLKWWLDAGTLLGAIREKGFIEHDRDIDIESEFIRI
jgi:phosphorylcholine metabolism protein LicD